MALSVSGALSALPRYLKSFGTEVYAYIGIIASVQGVLAAIVIGHLDANSTLVTKFPYLVTLALAIVILQLLISIRARHPEDLSLPIICYRALIVLTTIAAYVIYRVDIIICLLIATVASSALFAIEMRKSAG